MYLFVHLNAIGVEAMVDMRATYSCLATLVVAKQNLRIKPHASAIIPLNGTNQQVNGIIWVVPIQIGAWSK